MAVLVDHVVVADEGLSGGGVALPESTKWTSAQRRVLVSSRSPRLWIFRTSPVAVGRPGSAFRRGSNSTVAALMVVVMFLVPDGRGSRLLDWKSGLHTLGILLLFGGGIALAQGFKSSGLSDVIAGQLVIVREFLMILVICLFVTFLTEVTSNTAITVLLMPILAAAGQAADMDPAKLMVPAAMSASCAFMMPVATAPNAVVYGTGRIPMKRMNLEGFALNVAGALLITSITVVAL